MSTNICRNVKIVGMNTRVDMLNHELDWMERPTYCLKELWICLGKSRLVVVVAGAWKRQHRTVCVRWILGMWPPQSLSLCLICKWFSIVLLYMLSTPVMTLQQQRVFLLKVILTICHIRLSTSLSLSLSLSLVIGVPQHAQPILWLLEFSPFPWTLTICKQTTTCPTIQLHANPTPQISVSQESKPLEVAQQPFLSPHPFRAIYTNYMWHEW